MGKCKEMEYLNGMMGKFTKDNSIKENCMEKEFFTILTGKWLKEYGIEEKIYIWTMLVQGEVN